MRHWRRKDLMHGLDVYQHLSGIRSRFTEQMDKAARDVDLPYTVWMNRHTGMLCLMFPPEKHEEAMLVGAVECAPPDLSDFLKFEQREELEP